jgi:hypothetical protein
MNVLTVCVLFAIFLNRVVKNKTEDMDTRYNKDEVCGATSHRS